MELLKKIINLFKKKEDKKEPKTIRKRSKKIPEYCEFPKCKNKLSILNYFKCHYCKNFFCHIHRLPEEHNCKGNVKNPYNPTWNKKK